MISSTGLLGLRDVAERAGRDAATAAFSWVGPIPQDDAESILHDDDPAVLDRYEAPPMTADDIRETLWEIPAPMVGAFTGPMLDAFAEQWETLLGGAASCAMDWHEWRLASTGAYACDRCHEIGTPAA